VSRTVAQASIKGVQGVYDRHDYVPEKADAVNKLAGLIDTIMHSPAGSVVG